MRAGFGREAPKPIFLRKSRNARVGGGGQGGFSFGRPSVRLSARFGRQANSWDVGQRVGRGDYVNVQFASEFDSFFCGEILEIM
jgi:hypothetical protein